MEIIGPMKLTLSLELEETDDANIFVGLQKFHQGKEVVFEGVYGFPNDIVAKGTCILHASSENILLMPIVPIKSNK